MSFKKVKFKIKASQRKKITLVSLFIVSILLVLLAIIFSIDFTYADKFYPGLKINQVHLGGLSYQQAEKIFKAKIEELNNEGQEFIYQNKKFDLYPTTYAEQDPDLVHELISFEIKPSLDKAFALGKGQNFWEKIWQKIKYLFNKKSKIITFHVHQQEIFEILKENFSQFEKPVAEPQIEFVNNLVNIAEEKNGLVFNYDELLSQLKNNLASLNYQPIQLELKPKSPEFKRSEVLFLTEEIQAVDKILPVKIYATSTQGYQIYWTVSQDEFRNWLKFEQNKISHEISLSLNSEKIQDYLELYKFKIERAVQEPKMQISNGRAVEFKPAKNGQEINLIDTVENFEKDVLVDKKNESKIILNILEPHSDTASVNDLGIQELLGVGKSNFAGSPWNRMHNIRVGAQSLNGLLIVPGEEFSTNQALGEVNAAKGYLPELVIKGNETVPEYGGGLCQIATTAFRMAINTGMEITARKNHAYRVSYYEPAGTDATIYNPWPDFRFKNNTDKYVLLQTRVEGYEVIFELWGTHDGRQVATTTPQIWNIVRPAETKYIETTDLEPEKIKCIESAHNGADAQFTRTITYPDGETKEEVWSSHYRPWQAVCLVGVDPSQLATSTEEIIEE